MDDLYQLLGVDKDADDDTIKRAYRQQARKHHPDAGGDEEHFKRVTTAYEVLRNSQARSNYDNYGDPRGPSGGGGASAGFGDISDLIDAFFGGVGGTRAGGGRGRSNREGRDAIVDITITLAEAASGVRREVETALAQTCEVCDGSGAAPGTQAVRCTTCGGAGAVQQVTRTVLGQMLATTVCPACRGAGQEIADKCEGCFGEGRRKVTEKIGVDVPPGVDHGTRLKLAGRGEAGMQGATSGHLYVRIRVRPHDVFTRDGNDLHCELRVAMVRAALGTELTIPTLDGEAALDVPAGTQTGDVIKLRRQGMPKLNGGGARGDLHIHCRVETPTRLSVEEQRILREFADMRGEQVSDRSDGKGLLGRLREAFGG